MKPFNNTAESKDRETEIITEMYDFEGKSDREILIDLAKQMQQMNARLSIENKEIKENLRLETELRNERELNIARDAEIDRKIEEKLEEKLENRNQDKRLAEIEKRLEQIEGRSETHMLEISGIRTSGASGHDAMEEQLKKMNTILERKKREERKKNFVIKGLEIRQERQNLKQQIEKFLKEKLKIEVTLEQAKFVGKKGMIQVRVQQWDDKSKIMKNKKE